MMRSLFSSITATMRFKSLAFMLCRSLSTKFAPFPVENCKTIVSFYMHMDWFMLSAVKEEREAKKPKYFRHK